MKTLLLLIDILEENQIPPEKLHKVLENCLHGVQQYLNSPEIQKQEIDFLLGRELENVLRPFVNLLDYTSTVRDSKSNNEK